MSLTIKSAGTKIGSVFLLLSLALIISCSNPLNISKNCEEEFGSLTISNSSRALNVSDMSYAKAYVSGLKSDGTKFEVSSTDFSAMIAGAGSATVKNIPAGKNRIVTVYAYDSEKNKLGTVMVRKVMDINSGNNTSGTIDKTTTAIANVFDALMSAGYNISSISAQTKTSIEAKIDSTKSWALINTSKIASDFNEGGLNGLGSASSYVLEAGSVSFKNYYEGCTVQIGDPVSSIRTNVSAGDGSVTNVAPGTWPVYVIVAGETVKKTYVTVRAGADTNIGNLGTVTDRIIVHAKYTHIWAWKTGDANTNYTGGTWPGEAMTAEGNGWYGYTFETGKTAIDVLLSNNGSNKSREDGGDSLTAGEWWYDDGEWKDYNPDDNIAPVLEAFTCSASGTLTCDVDFVISASDNKGLKTAVISVDGVAAKTLTLSGTSYNDTITIDTSDFANGTHSVSCVVYDLGGNPSDIKTISNLTFQNANKIPVAVITGPSRAAPEKTVEYSAASSTDKNGSVVAYEWSVTGDVTACGTNSTISVTAPDTEDSTFTVKLRVQDNDGAWSEWTSKSVTVKTVKSNDFREETIYFLMTARFYDGDSSNNRWTRPDDDGTSGNKANGDYPWRGDFKGLIEKLDYIKALGFSAIWITPPVLNRSDYDFHGYHAWNMNKIDPRLESADADYQALIDACHEKGIKVIQDIVLNHSCRYGLEDLSSVKFWGDRDNQYWGSDSDTKYYDEYNPDFTYNGLDYEPNSGRSYYNGDLWQKEKPVLSWNPDLSEWGKCYGRDDHNREYYGFQWPSDGCHGERLFDPKYFHGTWLKNWEDETCQTGNIHEDCYDLNTEDADVQKYLIDAYSRYIAMGVDAFRIDTVKHMSRNTLNRRFIPAFHEAAKNSGNDHFYMFGEVCTRVNEVWNHNVAPLSAPFYTWKERKEYSADDTAAAHEAYEYENGMGTANQPTSNNHYLNGNEYHTPDYENASGLNVIDFPMHWNFSNASSAYGVRGNDKYYNDATWNVVYVDSHDYGPNSDNRYDGGTDAWAENMTYMWTFRGIPCLYYGSEIEFQHGAKADAGSVAPLSTTGRAYYGDHLEGSVTATDYGEWTGATGALATTLANPLCAHVARLNKIRRAIPALQKGQYSNDDCDGGMCYKRRFTDTADDVDSFVLVTVSGGATFKNLPGGTYVDVVTGDTQTISNGGTITATCSGQGNARIYVLQNQTASDYGANKQIGTATNWLK